MIRITVIMQLCIVLAGSMQLACKSEFETLRVESCTPSNHEYGVLADTEITIRFNNDVNKKDIEEHFSLVARYTSVPGTFTWTSDSSFIFTSQDDLEQGEHYTITIPEDARDRKGNTMQQAYISDFYVGNDFERPEVIGSVPVYTEGGTLDVALTTEISVSFSKSMNINKTEAAFSISPSIQGTFVWSEATAGLANSKVTFQPTDELDFGTHYTLTIASTAEDTEGNTVKDDYEVIFFTGSHTTKPSVQGIHDGSVSINPVYWTVNALNENISKNMTFAVQFSEDMDHDACELAFSISPSVSGRFTWDNDMKMIFTPDNPLRAETLYTITIDSSAKDRYGLRIGADYTILLKTNALDSQYLTITEIRGSTDNMVFTTLFTGNPVPDNMPYAVTRAGDGHYYILITFSTAMDVYTAYDALDCDALDPETGSIEKIEWISATQLKVILKDLVTATTYRLSVAGDSTGVLDTNGNTLEADFIFEIRE